MLRISIGFLVTAGCLVAALWGVDFAQVTASLGRATYSGIPLYLAMLLLFFLLKAYRWTLLLRPLKRLRTPQVFPSLMITPFVQGC